MFNIFIKRPILSAVISLLIVFLGLLSIGSLPVTQFPEIMPPSVTVTATYVGANSDVLAKTVAVQIERAINGVAGMTYMTTVCNNDGFMLTTVFFKVGTDPDVAAVNVQNRVVTVYDELPEEVTAAGVIVEKEVNSMLMYLNIISQDTAHNERFIFNFADINLLRDLKRIDGVAYAEIMGSREFAMRVWMNPDRMAAFNLSPQDVTEALRRQNVEAAPGKTGISSGKMEQQMQYVLQYSGRFTTPEEYGEIVLKALPDGSLLTLHDVAEIEFDSQEYNMTSFTDGRPSASIMIKQRPGSNARQVITDIKAFMEKVKEDSFAPGMDYNIAYDVSRFLDASISVVIKTLLEAFLLVSLVVFLFLQDWRSTLIPALAVPISLIGTFFFMQILGFSINMLTLFALVLAIGIVVDNAIIVVEAVHVKMRQGLSPYDATLAAMKEIGGAIVAITLVMSAVFVPVGFLEGTVGIFYRQFSLTLAVAIVISGVNALTLSPALCAIILRHQAPQSGKRNPLKKFFPWFNTNYERFASFYLRGLTKYLDRRSLTWITLLIFCVLTWLAALILPSGFIPEEDQGMVYVNVETPPGATLERTDEVLLKIQAALLPVEDVESISTLGGYSLLTESDGASYGMGMVNLTAWKDRKKSATEMMEDFKVRVGHIKDAQIEFFFPPAIPGFGNASGFEVRLLDLTGGDIADLGEVANNFLEALNAHPQLQNVSTGFNLNFPRYLLHADLQKAAQLGVSVDEAMEAMQSYVGSYYATSFIKFGHKYKVMLQAAPEFRANPEDIFRYYAKSKDGEMVPFSNFMTAEKTYGPEQITRYNMYTSAMLNGEGAPDVSSGQAIAAVEDVARRTLPKGYSIEWSGISREEQAQGNQAIWIFAVCLLFVYLLLSAQYENWLLPIPVVLSLPAGVFGTFLFLKLTGLENNIYAQVALIMLIGLLGKNAILMIEMANQNHRKKGLSVVDAAIKGAMTRLRPILMTSFAFIFGLIPLIIATGAGAIGNRSIGTAAAGGMLVGTMVGIFLVPGLFIQLRRKPPNKIRIMSVGKIIIIIIITQIIVMGCGFQKIPPPEKIDLPGKFVMSAGSNEMPSDPTTIATIKWSDFFPDTNLQKYIQIALNNNYSYAVALERVNQARLVLSQSKLAYLPQLDAGASAGVQRFGEYHMDGIGNRESATPIPDPYRDFNLGLRFQWEINVAGKLKNQKRAALARYMASEEALNYVHSQLVCEVATLYYELIGLDRRQAIYHQYIESLGASLELTNELVAHGFETSLASEQFEAKILSLKGMMLWEKHEISVKERALSVLLGVLPTDIIRMDFDKANAINYPEHTGIPAQIIRYRPDIREAEMQLYASKLDVAVAHAAFFPSIIIGGGGEYNSFDLSKWFKTPASLVYDLTAGLTAPLFRQREIRTLWENAKNEQRIALKNYHQQVITAYAEVLDVLSEIETTENMTQLKKQEVALYHHSQESALELFKLDFASYLEVLSVIEKSLDAELEFAQLSTAHALTHILLYRSLGGG